MGDVIKLHRVEEDKEQDNQQIKDFIDRCFESGHKKIAMVVCSENMVENFDAHFATNFEPGICEIMAIDVLSDYLRGVAIEIEENNNGN